MNDLTSQISQLLSNPEMMEQIKGLSGLIGQSAPEAPAQPPPKAVQPSAQELLGNDGMQLAMKLIPMLNSINKEDDTTRLLRAIKPFLGSERGEKIEEAIKLLQVLKILPLFKGDGFLGLF